MRRWLRAHSGAGWSAHLRQACAARWKNFCGLLAEPVQRFTPRLRVHLVQSGELNIDVAFGVPSCDEFGNANGLPAKLVAVHWAHAMVDADSARSRS